MVRSRACLPTLAASANRVVTTTSNRSSTSSCALASSVRTKASRVAARRSLQPRHGLGLGDHGETRQRRHPSRWDMRRAGQAQGKRPHLVEAGDGAGQLGAAAEVWPVAQPIERAGPSSLPGKQQGVKLRALLSGHVAGQGAPEPSGGAGADARDQAFKGRCSRQQDLLRHQPGRGAVRAGPAQRTQPAGQAEPDKGVGELAVAVALPDFGRVQPPHPASVVLRQANPGRRWQAALPGRPPPRPARRRGRRGRSPGSGRCRAGPQSPGACGPTASRRPTLGPAQILRISLRRQDGSAGQAGRESARRRSGRIAAPVRRSERKPACRGGVSGWRRRAACGRGVSPAPRRPRRHKAC